MSTIQTSTKSKILVTGASGFIASHLLNILPKCDVIDLGLGTDICEELPKKPYTHIFHLAAMKSVWQGELYPKKFIDVNCWGSVNLMRAYPNARILNISSSSVNDVRSIYGATKAFSELLSGLHPNWINVRLYNVFGEGQDPATRAIMPTLMKCAISGEEPIIYGDGNQSRDFTYVGDVVNELERIMFKTVSANKLHNVGYGDSMSINDLARFICGNKVKPQYAPMRGYEIIDSKSPYRMSKVKFGRIKGIQRTLKWFKENYE